MHTHFFKDMITCVAEESQKAQFAFYRDYANFLINNLNSSVLREENPEDYLNKAIDICEKESLDNYEVILNMKANYKARTGKKGEALKLYKNCIDYCKGKDFIHPHSWTSYANILFEGSKYEEAEKYCMEVINEKGISDEITKSAYHTLGLMVGKSKYNFEGNARPNLEEALRLLENAFESELPNRNKKYKTHQDAITHRALKDVFEYWSKNKLNFYQKEENRNYYNLKKKDREKALTPKESVGFRYLKNAIYHFNQAFTGLQFGNPTVTKIIRHVFETQSYYCRFLHNWGFEKAAYIWAKRFEAQLFKYDIEWDSAYELFMYCAVILSKEDVLNEEQQRRKRESIIKLSGKANDKFPIKTNINELSLERKRNRSLILKLLGGNLHYRLKENINALTNAEIELETQKIGDMLVEAYITIDSIPIESDIFLKGKNAISIERDNVIKSLMRAKSDAKNFEPYFTKMKSHKSELFNRIFQGHRFREAQ